MGGLSSVDVRDMLCAQALAVVARAVERALAGEGIEVRYNAEDVKQDLMSWARDRGHGVLAAREHVLRIEKRAAHAPAV
jgi:TusA-related sulfurtransferase